MSRLPFEEPREQECKKQAKVLVCYLEGEANCSETTAEKKQNEGEENDRVDCSCPAGVDREDAIGWGERVSDEPSKRESTFLTKGPPVGRCVSRSKLGTYHGPAAVLGAEDAGVGKTDPGILGIDREKLQGQLTSPSNL